MWKFPKFNNIFVYRGFMWKNLKKNKNIVKRIVLKDIWFLHIFKFG